MTENILGQKIKSIRKSKNMTQNELSKLTGYKQNTISSHENGNRKIDELDIRVYAKALSVKPSDLFKEESSENEDEDIKVVSEGFKNLTPAERKKAIKMLKTLFDNWDDLSSNPPDNPYEED